MFFAILIFERVIGSLKVLKVKISSYTVTLVMCAVTVIISRSHNNLLT